ncbi:conserved oligomeric Golgi complex subunit 1 isoform X1 [Fopius arisanus]|uniref:Conserved oligomeric Golgi complex subunit 1 n=1 Tax=Fopius arisanus TaxID=64838 RepID=A0A9R1U0Z8_9HYME|nr:PREDICTED: conserved oligomeric Golgi complex subunit 1 isoform X1 [Fopius arisanus]
MSHNSKNYHDLDITKLFEEHTIKEIEQIQKKILVDIDWKKVELRTLVGERYRDLIQAADTIAEMKRTSGDVIQRIAGIEDKFRELQQKYLIGFKLDPPEKPIGRLKSDVFDSVVVQIKILVDIPEYIWSAIDARDILRASQLFILGQHINYSLTFEIGQSVLNERYPLVGKQWCIINNFRSIISGECSKTLQSLDLTPGVAANCLSSLVLMEKTSSKDLFEKIIQFRSKAIESIVKDESPHSVRHRIKLCVRLLMDTIVLIHSCFIKAAPHDEGLISHHIKSITIQEASTMLSQLDVSPQLLDKYLPSVTKNHKPFAKGEFKELSPSDVTSSLSQWFSWVKKFTSVSIRHLLNLVTSVRGLFTIREESIALELPSNWTNIWKDLSSPPLNFWTEFFHPLLTERVMELLKLRLETALGSLKTSIIDFLTKLPNEKFSSPEHDLQWLVWKDSPLDIPQKLSKSSSLDTKRSLLMKARGYSSNLVGLCESLDKDLHNLLSDLEQYLYESENVPVTQDLLSLTLSSVIDKFWDRTAIQEDLQRTSASLTERIVEFIRLECTSESPKFGKREINAIVMARFLQAMTSICPSLNKCFTLSKISGLTITNVKWQNVCDKMREETTNIWLIWVSCYREKLKSHLHRFLVSESIDGLRIRSIVCEWERVTIEEEGEEGRRIKSEILVPYQPSVSLQKFLAAVTRDLNKVIPHTIPKKVVNEFSGNVVGELFGYFEGALEGEIRQKQAFQVLLDVKYVTMMLVPRESKQLVDRSQEICNRVLASIDPFDSDVFYPFIHVNVKKSVQRTLLIFGNLVPHLEQLHSVLGARGELVDSGKSISDPPGVLAVCSGAPWFPPLAVTVPSRNLPLIPVAIPDKTQRKKVPVKEHTRSDSTGSTIKSGAAAFFGAMGTDWFGSN